MIKSLIIVIGSLYIATAPAADNPHQISGQSDQSACTTCHDVKPELHGADILNTKNLPLDLSRFKQDGVNMCGSCHDPTAYHKVRLNVDFPVPADLPLSQDSEMICLTCHYSHGRLDSDKPQASFSFMDRLTNDERLHKSYLLRRNNSNGELCLTCHNPNQGAK